MRTFKSFISLLLFQLLLVGICNGQVVYYVNGDTGNDSHDGLSAPSAWKTIQKSFNSATPGSTVLISAGVYHEQPIMNVSGTPGNPVVFKAAPGESVILDGTSMGGSTMITIIDQSHVRLQNLTIRNLVRNFAVGILVETNENGAVDDVQFKNLTVTNINWTNDPTVMPGPGNNSNPFLFYGKGITQANAISNVVVDSCEIFNNITGYSENLTFNGNVDGAQISNCIIHHNKNIGICIAGNYNACSVPALDHARNIHVFGNTVYYNISQAATSAGIYVDGGRKVIIERNSTYHNGVGIEIGCERDGLTDSCLVRDNIVFDNLDWGIGIGGYDPSTTGQVLYTQVSNNTLYMNTVNNSGMGEFYMPKASHCSFYNNIIYTSSQNIYYTFDAIDPQADNLFDYNCWYSPGNDPSAVTVNYRGETISSFSAFQSATGFEQHSFYNNPLLNNPGITSADFRLMENSPCIDSGDPSFQPAQGETDFGGFQRQYNNRVDVGAFEYRGPEATGDLIEKDKLEFYPNPCDKSIFIRGIKEGSNIKVTDLTGHIVSQGFYVSSGYNISGLVEGIYLITLAVENAEERSGKFLVIRN
jgi:hypothetical protein